MLYTWDKNFYEEGEERFSFAESLKWNKQVFESKVKKVRRSFLNQIDRVNGYIVMIKRSNFAISILIGFKVFLIKSKLKATGREVINVEKSPISNSRYVYYRYESIYGNYIKIRVSDHKPTKNDNSHIIKLV